MYLHLQNLIYVGYKAYEESYLKSICPTPKFLFFCTFVTLKQVLILDKDNNCTLLGLNNFQADLAYVEKVIAPQT